MLDAMRKLDETGLGVLFVAPEGVLRAVVTDGDIRRYILKEPAAGRAGAGGGELQPIRAAHGGAGAGQDRCWNTASARCRCWTSGGRVQDVVFAGGLDIDT